jgi:hypothetical protein
LKLTMRRSGKMFPRGWPVIEGLAMKLPSANAPLLDPAVSLSTRRARVYG